MGEASESAIAFLADGRLYVLRPSDDEPEAIESHYAQTLADRDEQAKQRHGWRSGNPVWDLKRAAMPVLPEFANGGARRVVRFGTVASGGDGGSMLYVLHTQNVSGLFEFDPKLDEERRLIHRSEFSVNDLDRRSGDGRLACSVMFGDGSINLAVAERDGRKLRVVTEGDSLDEAPAWLGSGERVVYQSAGVARSEEGFAVGQGPYRVEQLDLATGEIETLLEDDDHDYLMPRLREDGTLLFIRRPYDPRGYARPSAWRTFVEALLFPIRLLAAIVMFFNWFGTIFSGKPLLTASGPAQQRGHERRMRLWGRWIDASKHLKGGKGEGVPLAPKDWTLVRRTGAGDETVLASNVLCYDVDRAGAIVYTDGVRVVTLDASGAARTVCKSRFVERVVWL